ncbi:MAG TPA: hypothetical protein VMH05_15415 [Bryobacteraceae bacterium]|nr:hypothetical protein [Bryobacteraceae bacterium]
MPNNWTTYKLLCVATPDLETKQAAFHAANARFAERVTMPQWILFALASPRSDFDPQIHRRLLEANIRFCDFFVQIFGEMAPDPAYRGFVDLAMECTADENFPMRGTAVLFRNPAGASEEMQALRQQLLQNPHCTVYDFLDAEELDRASEAILANWYARIAKSDTAGA